MSIAGHLVGVTTEELGSTLTADLTIGDTVLQVDSTIFFDEESGGTVLIGGVKLDYEAFDDPDDEDADTDGPTELTLTAASPVAASEGDAVWAFDPTTGADDPVAELVALVTIDDRDPGDAVPARVRAGLVDQLDSDFETYLGKAVELDVIDGELVLVDILGSVGTGGVKAMQDQTVAAGAGGEVILTLSFIPIVNSEHLYISGVYQRGSEWSRDAWTVTVPDPDGVLRLGNTVAMEYLYTDPTPAPVETFSAPTWHDRTGDWGTHVSPITFVGIPADTEVGDLLVVVAIGNAASEIDDPRLSVVFTDTVRTFAVGYATDLSDVTCNVAGISDPLSQFAGIEVLAVRGDGPFAYDPARIAVDSPVHPAGAIGSVGGAGHGVIAVVAAAYGNTITLDWAGNVPDYDDWGGEGATSIVGNFGYCETEPPPSQTNPANADAVAVLIGLK